MVLDLVELPGGIGTGSSCPHCSKVYPHHDMEADKALKVPDVCERCGCPMDKKKELAFSNARAADEQQVWAHKGAAIDEDKARADAALAAKAAKDEVEVGAAGGQDA